MTNYYLNAEQAKVGVAAGMWTEQDLENARKSTDGHIKANWYLQVKAVQNASSGRTT